MGKKSTPPPVPDYAALAMLQGAANKDAAIATSRLGNPNIYGPLGNQTVSYGTTKTYDQAGYDQAVIDYNAMSADQKKAEGFPTKAKFTTDDFTTPTVTQTLTPVAQKTLEAQQLVEHELAGLGLKGTVTVANMLDKPFDPKLAGIKTDISGDVTPVNQTAFTADKAQRYVAAPTAADESQRYVTGPAAADQAQRYVTGPTAAERALGSVTGPTLQQGINTAGIAAMPVNTGMTGQQAIMSRLQPQLTQNENATRQRLANQGLVTGGEAYQNEMRTMGQNRNDLELQAAAQGINLDAMMNQQGFQQAQAQGQFGNEAQLAQFRSALENTGFGNETIQQNYQNQLAQFGAGLQNAALGNEAIQQDYGNRVSQFDAAMRNAALNNTAIQQDYDNRMSQFGVGMQNAALNNSAIQQDFQNQIASQSAENAAIAQNYNQQLGMAQFSNTAQDQSLAQQLALRNQPLNEITGLMSGSQIQMPQFQGYSGANIAASPIYQAGQDTFQGQMDQYAMRQQAKNNLTSGLMGLGGAGIGAAGMYA